MSRCCVWLLLIALSHTAVASEFTLYLVRHAEKAAPTEGTMLDHRDPPLSQQGQQRAQRLAQWLSHRSLASIWSSDYQRTRDTAQAAAEATGLAVRLYDPGQPEQLQEALSGEGSNALVVGHSNTIPELAANLCQCEVGPIEEGEYDQLLMVLVTPEGAFLTRLDQASLFRRD